MYRPIVSGQCPKPCYYTLWMIYLAPCLPQWFSPQFLTWKAPMRCYNGLGLWVKWRGWWLALLLAPSCMSSLGVPFVRTIGYPSCLLTECVRLLYCNCRPFVPASWLSFLVGGVILLLQFWHLILFVKVASLRFKPVSPRYLYLMDPRAGLCHFQGILNFWSPFAFCNLIVLPRGKPVCLFLMARIVNSLVSLWEFWPPCLPLTPRPFRHTPCGEAHVPFWKSFSWPLKILMCI